LNPARTNGGIRCDVFFSLWRWPSSPPAECACGHLLADVLAQYDLIGFDPRGIGHSTPVTCDIPLDSTTDLILPYPAPDGSIDRNVQFARDTARACRSTSGDLLPYITTANTARDMDRIRRALG
jgi:pimeloyl-ACP methyl ester carboxylesterase